MDARPVLEMTDLNPLPRPEGEIPYRGAEVDFDRLYELYGRRVYLWCAHMSGSKEEAEDLTQDSFLQLFRSIESFRGESGFATWLYRVVINVVQGRYRKKSVATISLDDHEEADRPMPPGPFEPADPTLRDPIDRLSLEKLMVRLPSVYRKILILHDIRGYRHVEIARMLGLPIGTTKAYLHRARRRLRDLYLASLTYPKRPAHQRAPRGRKSSLPKRVIGPFDGNPGVVDGNKSAARASRFAFEAS